MRPTHRAPLPDLDVLQRSVNALLEAERLATCSALVVDGVHADTCNPVVIGIAGAQRYAIKAIVRFPDRTRADAAAANAVHRATGLPIPMHLVCATDGGDPLL